MAGDFAPWVGAMIKDVNQPILLVTEVGKEEEAITRLSRIGFDNVNGYLKGGFNSWMLAGKQTDTVVRIPAQQFAQNFDSQKHQVIDIRRASEFNAEHIEDAYNKPLDFINDWIKDINPKQHFFIHCAGGYRSMIASSILQSRGYRNFTEIAGGFKEILKTEVPRTDFVCSTKKYVEA